MVEEAKVKEVTPPTSKDVKEAQSILKAIMNVKKDIIETNDKQRAALLELADQLDAQNTGISKNPLEDQL